MGIVEFVEDVFLWLSFGGFFVKAHDVHHYLWVLLLFGFGDAMGRKYALPFIWKTLDWRMSA